MSTVLTGQFERGLAAQPSARAACTAAGVPTGDLLSYARALQTLAASQMIRKRDAA